MAELRAWTLPFIVAAVVVPVVAGFAVGGPPLGLALGALAVGVIVFVGVRARPGGRIETAPGADDRRHVLVVISRELEDPAAIERIADEAGLREGDRDVDVRVLAPASTGFLARWASDTRRSRTEAQRKLVIAVAALGRAHVEAGARVGDEDIVQAVEDQLRSFPATMIVLATGTADSDPEGETAARELEARLDQPFRRVVLDRGAPRPPIGGPGAS
jgi:hypothetical protein